MHIITYYWGDKAKTKKVENICLVLFFVYSTLCMSI